METEARGRAFWQSHIDAWWAGGCTQRAYCREHGLEEGKFSQWKRRLRGARRRDTHPQLVPLQVIEASARSMQRGEGYNGSEAIVRRADLTLVLGAGLRLEIGGDFDSGALRRVLEVLGHVG